MVSWVDNWLQKAVSVSSHAELGVLVQAACVGAGFSSWSYLARVCIPITQPRNLFFASAHDAWSGGIEVDAFWRKHPVFSRVTSSCGPVVWNEGGAGGISQQLESIGLHKLRAGWAQCIWGAGGARGVFAVARAQGALTDAELNANTAMLSWFGQVVHAGMMALDARQRPAFEVVEPLTEREVEILRWTAEGKTASEVADILRIAERTVNFHITRCVDKLKVNNKLAATVRAVMLGLL